MGADRDLGHLFPDFREKVSDILAEMNAWTKVHKPGYLAYMVEGFRTAAYQASLFAQGRTAKGSIVTYKNGTTNPSIHQSSLAADIVPIKGTDIDWGDNSDFYAYLGHCARAHGLTWGGDYTGNFKDYDHIEWRSNDIATFKTAHAWQETQGLR